MGGEGLTPGEKFLLTLPTSTSDCHCLTHHHGQCDVGSWHKSSDSCFLSACLTPYKLPCEESGGKQVPELGRAGVWRVCCQGRERVKAVWGQAGPG